ncbi:type IV secretion system protein [Cronobacter sakazakii]|uniref:type IV secretion system protein n=1 Tax=Cronobacter sakazakii TaxID=28141 RepID=UPI001EF80216|nr:type IV secretion system protein [Cronobacter sakazakii]
MNPSTPIDIAFDIIAKAASSYSITSPMDNLSIFLTTLAILACMAIVAANVLLALVTAWIIAYAGIFVLGFGGSRWTSDIAVNYFRSVAGIALKIMTITLLVGIAVSIIDGYHSDLSEGAPMDELLVIFVVSLVMVILVNSVPNVVAGLIPGGGGAALGSAAMSGATNMAGGASAVKAAFKKAQSSMAGGDMPSFGGSSSDTGESWGGSTTGSDNASTGDTPFAQAAGFSGAGSSSSGGGFGRAASLAAGTAGELAKGVGAKMAGSFQDKANQTAGGRLASSIRESMEPKSDNDAGSVDQVSDTPHRSTAIA